jgi:hypothetical protein
VLLLLLAHLQDTWSVVGLLCPALSIVWEDKGKLEE